MGQEQIKDITRSPRQRAYTETASRTALEEVLLPEVAAQAARP